MTDVRIDSVTTSGSEVLPAKSILLPSRRGVVNFVLAEITWRPRVGDANASGWFITASYFAASFVCFLVTRRLRRAGHGSGNCPSRFWLILATMMFVFGWNKQLDLQTLLTQFGREISRSGGWYGQRRPIQAAFVFTCALLGATFAAAGLRVIRGQNLSCYLSYVGVIVLVTFIVIRAASFHHVDTLLFRLPIFGSWVNTALEFVGIALVLIGGLSALQNANLSK